MSKLTDAEKNQAAPDVDEGMQQSDTVVSGDKRMPRFNSG